MTRGGSPQQPAPPVVRSWMRWLPLALVVSLAGCSSQDASVPPELEDAPGFRQKVLYLEAPCSVNVEGVGMVDIEEDYIPGVVACENGGAPLEALKAQAVQARSFLYYKLFVAGQTTIRNSTADQVYSCSYRPNGPDAIHRQAAEETKAQYLTWENSIVASFYVAGAIPPNPDPGDPFGSCMGNGGNDPTSTQQWVTYNRGKTGCDIDLTRLGFVPADCRGNPHNRGCASQNGEACLARLGVGYQEMLKFHYGDDIVLEVADGRCGAEPISPEDQFCIDNGDGSHCLDAATRIACESGAAAVTEVCDEGCGEGLCLLPPDPTFCTGREDGSHCNGAAAVECAAEAISISEACPNGCTDGTCNAMIDNGNNSPTTQGNSNNDNVNPGDDDDGEINPRNDAVPPVIGRSPGIQGGCATVGDSAPGSLWLLALLFTGIGTSPRRRGRSTARASRPAPLA